MLRIPVTKDFSVLRDVSFNEMFDPRINKCWFNDQSKFFLSDYLKFIKLVYNRQNLIELVPHLFNMFGNEEHYNVQFRKLVTDLPENVLWVFAFTRNISAYWITDDTFALQLTTYTGRLIKERARFHAISYGAYKQFSTSNQINTPEHNASLVDFLTEMGETIEKNFAEAAAATPDAYIGRDYYSATITILNVLLRYVSNAPIIEWQGESYGPGHIVDDVTNCDATMSTDVTPYSVVIRANVPITKSNRKGLYKVFSYNENILSLLPWPITLAGEHQPLLLGVELELSTNYKTKDLIDAQDELFFALKSDSSVSGNKSYVYELVTVPMSFRAHKQQWARFFRKLDYKQFDTSHRTSNGMHVHIAREAFDDDKHIRNFAWFFHNPANYEFIFALSERDRDSFQSYSATYQFNERHSKTNTFKTIERYANAVRGCVTAGRKDKTVEVRLFRGVVSLAYVIKNLECVEALFEFTRNPGYQQLTTKGFMAWLDKQPYNRFRIFRKFLKGLNFSSITPMQEIKDIIFAERRAPQILAMLIKHKFRPTENHIFALNKIVGGVKFELDHTTGELKLLGDPTPANLHAINDSLAQRYAG